MVELEFVSLDEVQAARDRIACDVPRSPLIRLNMDSQPAEIYLKLENLMPLGSFKIRGAVNVLKKADKEQVSKGISSASSGNWALALAWVARQMGISCSVIVQDTTSETKLSPLKELGATFMKLPFDDWFEMLSTSKYEELEGFFIHPVFNKDIWAGHGTIAVEILEDLPDVDAVVLPYGGGGLCCGISSVFRALKPDTKFFIGEVDNAAPVTEALAAGEPKTITRKPMPFHCVGATRVLTPMWPLVSQSLNGSVVVPVEEVAEAIRLLARQNHVIAEGSGALPVAGALTGKAGSGKVVCVVTGGNIGFDILMKILNREIP
jgi:threonine dehydratase